jgi:hypothetical protein
MTSIVTYDISSKHVEFKKEMFELGYKDQIKGNTCSTIHFPNTTLYHPTKTPSIVRVEVENVCKKLNTELERCVATVWQDWSAICGEPFK